MGQASVEKPTLRNANIPIIIEPVKSRDESDKTRDSNANRDSPVPRYHQKRRLSRSQRDRRSSLHRARLTWEEEDDAYMQIQQQLSSLGRYSTWKSRAESQTSTVSFSIPKTLWNRSIRNAVYGVPQYSSCDDVSVSENHSEASSKACTGNDAEDTEKCNKQTQGIFNANDKKYNIYLQNNHLYENATTHGARFEQNLKNKSTSFEEEEEDGDNEDDGGESSLSKSSEEEPKPRYLKIPKYKDSIKDEIKKVSKQDELDRTSRISKVPVQKDPEQNTREIKSTRTGSPKTERRHKTRQAREYNKDTDTDLSSSCVELDTDNEDLNKLNWRSRGYKYDFYLSRQSRTGTEIIQQYKQSISNKSSKTNSPHSSAESSRKSSIIGRQGSKRAFKHLGSLEENMLMPNESADGKSVLTSRRKQTTTTKKLDKNSEEETGVNANMLKVALERAAKCTSRLDKRLEKQLKN